MNPKRKPKRSEMEWHVYRKYRQSAILTDEQFDYFTQRSNSCGNLSEGVRRLIAFIPWPKQVSKVEMPSGKRRCITLCRDDILKLKQLGGSVNKGLQVAWTSYTGPWFNYFFRD